jgi:hypothetical protein
MKHLEVFGKWSDKLLNSFPFCLDDIYIKTVGIAWLFTVDGKWSFMPKIVPTNWQYANACIFIRIGLPFAFFMQLRASPTHLWQGGIGWKQSGRIAIHCRFQTDASSTLGYHPNLPNLDHASGFEYGRH